VDLVAAECCALICNPGNKPYHTACSIRIDSKSYSYQLMEVSVYCKGLHEWPNQS